MTNRLLLEISKGASGKGHAAVEPDGGSWRILCRDRRRVLVPKPPPDASADPLRVTCAVCRRKLGLLPLPPAPRPKPLYEVAFERNMAAGLNNGRTPHFVASGMSPDEYRAAAKVKRT